ncbi:MAG: hypothetical protein FJY82_13480 [Candidatus Aminicenantes bacterium]|nr:hypothetical protein [Candidatus Aminicenantes bacterium]
MSRSRREFDNGPSPGYHRPKMSGLEAMLLHYRLLEKIGEGGMGAVYKAFDTHLDRHVAIKVLPAEKTADLERRQRFVQEAKAASALRHPSIVVVHDIAEDRGVHFIVMEYVEGQTLDRLIGRKGIKLHETLGYAVQIADGLAKAHAAGIVHRDLKPTNIMVMPDGQVKILDFGLAKLVEDAEIPAHGPTRTFVEGERPRTEEGFVLGTAAYMSPEQAEGRKVDARTDIFSFGVVLYEMLTGQKAFHRETKVGTLAAILHDEPPPASRVNESLPADIEPILGRCLRKDPQRRWQSMSDLKVVLLDLKEDSESGKLRPPAAPAAEFEQVRLTFDLGLTALPAVSPDGNTLAYSSDRAGEKNSDIWGQRLDPISRKPTVDAVRLFQSRGQAFDLNIPAGNGALAVAKDKIVFYACETSGNIWVAKPKGR